jgi:hypothetical protein
MVVLRQILMLLYFSSCYRKKYLIMVRQTLFKITVIGIGITPTGFCSWGAIGVNFNHAQVGIYSQGTGLEPMDRK